MVLKKYWGAIKLFERAVSGTLRGCGKGIYVFCVCVSLSLHQYCISYATQAH